MTRNRKFALPVVAAIAVLGTMVIASSAMAAHARPNAATPFYVTMVTAMNPCTAPAGNPAGMKHGGTLAFASCQTGMGTSGPTSTNISFGSPGSPAPAPAQGTGFARICTSPSCGGLAPANAAGDMKVESVLTDVRCTGSTNCAPAGPGGSNNGAQTTQDYIGQIRGSATIRITDHNNGVACPPTCTNSATVGDLPFTVDGACAANTGTGTLGAPIGGTCTINTSANSAVPGAGTPGVLGNVETRQLIILDGGVNGSVADITDGPNLAAFKMGVAIP